MAVYRFIAEEKATPATTTPDPEPVEESATEGGVADEEESVVDE